MGSGKPFFLWRHLNKARWLSLSVVFAMLVLLPFLHLYQTYVAAHAYDLLSAPEQRLYDVMGPSPGPSPTTRPTIWTRSRAPPGRGPSGA